MQIQLEIINRLGLDPGVPMRFSAGDAPVVIGRGPGADWELPDASRLLSSSHCRVSRGKDGFRVEVLSANGAVLNGRSLGQGGQARLSDGDRLEIGPFHILASHWLSEGDGGKTVIHPPGASAHTAPRARPLKPDRVRAAGDEFVREFAVGAGIDPETLVGRTNLEFAEDLGGAMRSALSGFGTLARSASELRALVGSRSAGLPDDDADQDDPLRMLASLLAVSGPHYRRAGHALDDLAGNLQAHDAALFHAMQTALFRLLNQLAPTTIEEAAGARLLRSKKAKSWDLYVGTWEGMSIARENGMLDAFLDYFREAYDERMSGR